MKENKINTNTLSFIGLANEYCLLLENCRQSDKEEFIVEVLNLLPRIYITMNDISIPDEELDNEQYIMMSNYLEEDYYDSIRRSLESLIGEDDMFLETFEEDMKYSDTPIAVSISEQLTDIFQELFNFVAIVKDSEGLQTTPALIECKENFESYWSQKLCNVLRAINKLKYN